MATDMQIMTEEQVRKLAQEVLDANKKGKLIPSEAEIRQLLQELPPETERKFEKTVVDYSLKWDDTVISSKLAELYQVVKTSQPLTPEEEKIAFAAFCVKVNHARRMKNNSEEVRLLAEYRPYFEKDHVFFSHMHLLEKMEKLENFKEHEWDEANVQELLELAANNSVNLTNNIGGAHAFAETVALTYENVPDIMHRIKETKKVDWLKRAQTVIADVVKEDAYAKFYCTYARILSAAGDYDEALSKLNEAIDMEDDSRSDYAIRIGRYLTWIQQIRAYKQRAAMEKNANDKLKLYENALEEQEKQTMVKNMEFLGLFSGIVSFTIGSLTISGAIAEQSIKNAAGLIVVLMGALMGVFAAFGIILHGMGKGKGWRNVLVLLLGIGAIVGGILFCLN